MQVRFCRADEREGTHPDSGALRGHRLVLHLDDAFQRLSEVPSMPQWEEPGQSDLEAMLAAAGAMAAAVS